MVFTFQPPFWAGLSGYVAEINAAFCCASLGIVPTVRQIVAQGSLVVAYWDGQATAKDGSRYENSYSWHMHLENGRITRVTAFLDTWRLVQLME